ncbi:ABC transporter substrate-binding protein [Pikeienuella piscinae]|uniref:ABC transporter substrate-binding protein n=1 Tax=Pikeienuella piscinae TaxID=2748098 RepID=A0A7M3T6U0_9RHOB|nr:ABC transporter substrate-binding protein [Pikeienuella piscinae]
MQPTLTRRAALKGAAAMAGALAAPALSHAASRDDWIIRGSIPLTGPFAATGVDGLKTTQDWVEMRNASGGIAGRRIDLSYEDSGYYPKTSLENFRRVMRADTPPHFYFGDSTGFMRLVRPELARTPVLNGGASFAGEFARPRESPWQFIAGPAYGAMAEIAMRYIASSGGRVSQFYIPIPNTGVSRCSARAGRRRSWVWRSSSKNRQPSTMSIRRRMSRRSCAPIRITYSSTAISPMSGRMSSPRRARAVWMRVLSARSGAWIRWPPASRTSVSAMFWTAMPASCPFAISMRPSTAPPTANSSLSGQRNTAPVSIAKSARGLFSGWLFWRFWRRYSSTSRRAASLRRRVRWSMRWKGCGTGIRAAITACRRPSRTIRSGRRGSVATMQRSVSSSR